MPKVQCIYCGSDPVVVTKTLILDYGLGSIFTDPVGYCEDCWDFMGREDVLADPRPMAIECL